VQPNMEMNFFLDILYLVPSSVRRSLYFFETAVSKEDWDWRDSPKVGKCAQPFAPRKDPSP